MRTKKKLILPICIAVILTLAVGGTVAYIAVKTQDIINTFDASEVQVALSTPAQNEQAFTVQNNSDCEVYVRFYFVATWVNTSDNSNIYAGTPKPVEDFSFTPDGDVVKRGEFYYVTAPIEAGGEASLVSVEAISDAPDGYELRVEVVVDAIQSRPRDAVTQSWGVTLNDDGTIA